MNVKRPIVVFDSGFGGISVLKKLVCTMPNEDFLYFGDSANAPYGPRPQEQVRDLTVAAIQSLRQYDPKAVVIACNTATAAALEALRQAFPNIPVIGIQPALQEAVSAGKGGRILVLATEGTLTSPSFRRQMEAVRGEGEILPMAAPGLVTYVEGTMKEREQALSYLKGLFQPLAEKRVDGVVLGCTHFPFAKDVIREALGYPVPFFDASQEVARETQAALEAGGGRKTQQDSGSVTMSNSARKQELLRFAWNLFASEC